MKNHGCCDLEYAIRLKELGVKQESLFYWANTDDDEGIIGLHDKDAMLLVELFNIPRYEGTEYLYKNLEHKRNLIFSSSGVGKNIREDFCSAFTVAELQLKLMEYPTEINYMHRLCDFTANYLAKILIHLKENEQ